MNIDDLIPEIDGVTQNFQNHFGYTDYVRSKLFEHARRDANRHNNALELDSNLETLSRVNNACTYAVQNFQGELSHQFIRDVAYRVDPNNLWYSDGWRDDQRHSVNIGARMEELLYRVNGEGDFNDVHPLQRIGEFHYGMLEVHPFIDGNGRTTRILNNVLMEHHGYAPFLVRSEDRSTYISLLEDCTRQLSRRGDLRHMFSEPCFAQDNFYHFLGVNALKQANDMVGQLSGLNRYTISVNFRGPRRRLCGVTKFYRHALSHYSELLDVNTEHGKKEVEIITKSNIGLIQTLMENYSNKNRWIKGFKVKDTTSKSTGAKRAD